MSSPYQRIPAEEEEEEVDPLLYPRVTRLSQLHGGGSWQKKANDCGETPTIDFAFSQPFR